MTLGTWNVLTMLQPGKMAEIADELMKYQTNICALQEIRWKGDGEVRKKAYSIFFSGSETQGLRGTGFYVDSKTRKSILNFSPVNDRICYLRLQGKFQNITIISIYAPTNDSTDAIKDKFYDDLSDVTNNICKHDILLIVGDYNAKVGKEEGIIDKVAGKFSIHNHTNDNGMRMCSFASAHGLVVSSTAFKHKRIHLQTWKMPGRNMANQIDHILTDKRHATSVIDVRSYRGACCDTDHYLVVAKLRQRISIVNDNKGYKKLKWNTDELINNEDMKAKYKYAIENILFNENSTNNDSTELDIEDQWNKLKATIIKSAKNTIGEKRSVMNEWYDEECRAANYAKKEARIKYMERNTRTNRLYYVNKRKEAKKIMRKKKKTYMKRQIEQIESDFRNKNVRAMYQNIKKQTKTFQPRTNICKAKDGSIISEKQQVIDRWKEYFKELLNKENYDNTSKEEQVVHTAEIYVEEPSFDEVLLAIRKLKNHKSCGEDGIPAELLKYGGHELHKQIFTLVSQIWHSNEIPTGWASSIIVPIHKKGHKTECQNYRGISLLNTGYKVFTNILFERLNIYAENILDDYQCGFRNNRSTIDQGFTVHQIFEKFYEYKIDIFCLFVDFKQAFDSINRKRIKYCFQKIGIPLKLINLILCTLSNTTSKVLVQGSLSDPFEIISGVKQGDALSCLVFNLMLHTTVKEINTNGTLFNNDFQICAYADDILIMAKDRNTLIRVFKFIDKDAKALGLHVNTEKTKYMIRSVNNTTRDDLSINNFAFENITEFKYLGFKLSADKDSAIAINDRIQAANNAYYVNIKLFKSKDLSRAQKIRMYKTLIRPVLTYGAEIWTLKTNDIHQLMCFERRIIRKIYGPVATIDGSYRIRYNDEIEEIVQGQNIIRFIKAQRIRWIGHVLRMPKERIARKAFILTPIGGRKRGRPRKRWLDDVESDLKQMNVHNWRDVAMDRIKWRKIVDEAMVHHGL